MDRKFSDFWLRNCAIMTTRVRRSHKHVRTCGKDLPLSNSAARSAPGFTYSRATLLDELVALPIARRSDGYR
jgi:hypothetical protein